jgi:hypothetical protein
VLKFLLILTALLCRAAEPVAARWEGTVRIPGREVRLVLDLAPDTGGRWTGSAILPDRGIKGAPLSDISVHESDVSATIPGVLGDPRIVARLAADGTLEGELRQGGNTAPLALKRTGPPQVDLPRRSTPVPKELEGEWQGEMTVRGNPVRVKVTMSNRTGEGATAKMVITGRRETALDIDMVTEQSGLLTLEVLAASLTIEGRFHKESGEIAGTYEQGPIEAGLVLHRTVH